MKRVWVSCGTSTALYILLRAGSMEEMVVEAAERLPVIPLGPYIVLKDGVSDFFYVLVARMPYKLGYKATSSLSLGYLEEKELTKF